MHSRLAHRPHHPHTLSRRTRLRSHCARAGLLVAALAVAGCDELLAPEQSSTLSPSGQFQAGPPAPTLRVEEREVERPDIFSTNAQGLWDGRFSLGGTWVAVEQQVEPERVRITNTDNGSVVEGALFRREANLPGPPIMVSLDAAQALGMRAGAPANLEVVVLRVEQIEIVTPPPAADPEPVAETAEEVAEPAAEEAAAPVAAAAAAATTAAAATAPDLETTVLNALDEAPAPAASGRLPQPYIQVSGGRNKSGADRTLAKVAGEGLPVQLRYAGTDGSPIYRVVVGPFQDAEKQAAALEQLKGLGFDDAFTTR